LLFEKYYNIWKFYKKLKINRQLLEEEEKVVVEKNSITKTFKDKFHQDERLVIP
jgi:hypothetical protein